MREGIPFSCFLLMSVNLGGGRQIIWNRAAIFRVLSSKKHPKNGHIPEISSFFTYLSKFRVFCLDLLATLLELEFDLSWRLFYPVLKYTIQYYGPWTRPYLPYATLPYTYQNQPSISLLAKFLLSFFLELRLRLCGELNHQLVRVGTVKFMSHSSKSSTMGKI